MGCSKSTSIKSTPPFIWGSSGSVLIKSLKLVLSYDPLHKSIITRIPNDKITESLLTWQGRLFTLQDLYITDLTTQKRLKCPEIQAKFSITDYDQFNKLHETEVLVTKITELQSKNLDSQRSKILINGIERDCKELWHFSKEIWVKHKILAEKSEILHCGKECLQFVLEKKTSDSKIQRFLVEKYKASSFTKLKKDVKAKAVLMADDQRPHIVKVRKSILLDFYVEVQHLLEVEESVKVFVFCWDDVPELADPGFMMKELERMQKGTKVVYNDLKQDIDMFK